MSMFILTRELNEYDQWGEYFVAAFSEKPTVRALENILGSTDLARHVLTGGGRQEYEYAWYFLREVQSGQVWEYNE